MISKWKQVVNCSVLAGLLAVLPACPPQAQQGELYAASDPFRNMVDMKDYFPMARGNYWRWENPDFGQLLIAYEDHSTSETEIWLMNSYSYNEYGVRATQYYMIWTDNFAFTLPKEKEDMLEYVADPDTDVYNNPNVNILFTRYFHKSDYAEFSHASRPDKLHFLERMKLGHIDSVGCSPSEGFYSYVSYDMYPLPYDTKVVLHKTRNQCDGPRDLVGMKIYAEGIGLLQYGDMQLTAVGLHDGTRVVETLFNPNGYPW